MTVAFSLADVERVRNIAVRAGDEIMRIYRTDFAVETKGDQSPVTEADRIAESLIIGEIRAFSEAFPIVGEEAFDAGHVPAIEGTPFWLVDPLDGTKEFIKHRDEFTVNIALIDTGRPAFGVVHAPALETTYWGSANGSFADSGDGGSRSIAVRPPPTDGLVAVVSHSHRNPEVDAYLTRFNVKQETSAGSSLKFCLVAAGLADIYPRTGTTMEWDTAAGHAVLRFAGGHVTDMNDNELTYGKPGFENPHFVAFGERMPNAKA